MISTVLLYWPLDRWAGDLRCWVLFLGSSPPACAIGNIVPALTFAIAAALRMETVQVQLGTLAGKACTLVFVGFIISF